MKDNNPLTQSDNRGKSFLLAGKLTATITAVSIALPNLVALLEAIERNRFASCTTAIVIVAWFCRDVSLALVNNPQRS
ncbi:hypothetical protein HD842_004160 [Massilia aurea]|uniref:Uncharacterized protein n=1 Tax=Massilia aurea TaxID=373040 RepID=A0A7W9X3T5_9BURK|nr:hypothetical protein [Massilia aurea]MBB6135983.1 hypothetical protein [Massilia aurea]